MDAADDQAEIERLAWHLFTEHDDMTDDDTIRLAHSVWENPRHAGTRQACIDRARRYLEIAAVCRTADQCWVIASLIH